MSSITVTAAHLKSSASELENLNSQFKSAVNDLESLEGTLRSSYEGESSDAFHNMFTSNNTQMNNFYNAIVAYVHALHTLAEKYVATEQKNAQIASDKRY